MQVFKLRFGVLIKHPNLVTRIYRGEAQVSKSHVRIELEAAKSLFLLCQSRGKNITETIQEFKSRICYGNAYLYAVCKLLRPRTIVETGVKRGTSTAFILQAILENGNGHLYSIDLPNVIVDDDASNVLPEGTKTGYLVPPELVQGNWALIYGDSRNELPKLLDKVESISIFHHDSLHTYDHMLFEYRSVWPKLSKGGVLLSDDARSNGAFTDFCSEIGVIGSFVGDSGIAFKDS